MCVKQHQTELLGCTQSTLPSQQALQLHNCCWKASEKVQHTVTKTSSRFTRGNTINPLNFKVNLVQIILPKIFCKLWQYGYDTVCTNKIPEWVRFIARVFIIIIIIWLRNCTEVYKRGAGSSKKRVLASRPLKAKVELGLFWNTEL